MCTAKEVEKDTARSQAKAQLESITGMILRLNHCDDCDDSDDCTEHNAEHDRDAYHDGDDARQAIYDDPLEISVRSDWHSPGKLGEEAEYMILLCTGGPACRIVGELTAGEPTRAGLQYQDWFTPWTDYIDADQDTLLEYARHFIVI